jgi:hypothetical protein
MAKEGDELNVDFTEGAEELTIDVVAAVLDGKKEAKELPASVSGDASKIDENEVVKEVPAAPAKSKRKSKKDED